MIIKRQSLIKEREFSYKSVKRAIKLRAGLKGIGNQIMTKFDNMGLEAGNTAKEIVTGKPTPQHMKVKFQPKTREQLRSEAIEEAKAARNVKNSAVLDPEGFSGKVTKAAANRVTTAPLSTAGKVAIDINYPGAPTTTPYFAVSSVEQKVWDKVNNAGVGNYTLGRITSPVKKTIRNVAEPLGRAAYRHANIVMG